MCRLLPKFKTLSPKDVPKRSHSGNDDGDGNGEKDVDDDDEHEHEEESEDDNEHDDDDEDGGGHEQDEDKVEDEDDMTFCMRSMIMVWALTESGFQGFFQECRQSRGLLVVLLQS